VWPPSSSSNNKSSISDIFKKPLRGAFFVGPARLQKKKAELIAAHTFAAVKKSGAPLVVGMAGSSGSGKTTVLRALRSAFPEGEIAVVSQDNYYLPRHLQLVDERGVTNFDRPESIDLIEFSHDLMLLIAGQTIEQKEYTYNNPDAAPNIISVSSAPIIVVEGLFVFHYPETDALLDLRVFIMADDQVSLARRIKRDTAERGYPESDVRYRWEHHVRPAYEQYLLPHLSRCDVVIHNNANYAEDLAGLVQILKDNE